MDRSLVPLAGAALGRPGLPSHPRPLPPWATGRTGDRPAVHSRAVGGQAVSPGWASSALSSPPGTPGLWASPSAPPGAQTKPTRAWHHVPLPHGPRYRDALPHTPPGSASPCHMATVPSPEAQAGPSYNGSSSMREESGHSAKLAEDGGQCPLWGHVRPPHWRPRRQTWEEPARHLHRSLRGTGSPAAPPPASGPLHLSTRKRSGGDGLDRPLCAHDALRLPHVQRRPRLGNSPPGGCEGSPPGHCGSRALARGASPADRPDRVWSAFPSHEPEALGKDEVGTWPCPAVSPGARGLGGAGGHLPAPPPWDLAQL